MNMMRSTTHKRKNLQPQPQLCLTKKLRSNLPRRRRRQILPLLLTPPPTTNISGEDHVSCSLLSVDSSSHSHFPHHEVSCKSIRASAVSATNASSYSRQRVQKDERAGSCRNRTFQKHNGSEVEVLQVSESSFVHSNSGLRESRSLNLKLIEGKEKKNVKEKLIEGKEKKSVKETESSEAWTKSEVTCEEKFSGEDSKSGTGNLKSSSEICENDVVSVSSGVDEAVGKLGGETTRGKENRASVTKQWSDESDLVCTEQLSYNDDVSKCYSSQETAFYEIFPECSEVEEISDYSSSLFTDSGSQFSAGSVGETHSPTYSLFLQYSKEFSWLASPPDTETLVSFIDDDDNSKKLEFVRLEDEEDEESYQMLRKRERRQVFLWNYGEKYCRATGYGELVLQQRSRMVNWIVEQSCRKQLREESMFLGVSLLDRFLSKGYFKAKRSLQIVGIACLTLATRIEENQTNNRMKQNNFHVGSSAYSRCEVVAMEWMVHEVLNFQFFLPTINNFLWFYLKAAKADADVEKRVKHLAVLALSAHEQLCYWPSTVAAALVIMACLEANQNASHKVIGIHVRSKDENLHECMESLEWLLRYL